MEETTIPIKLLSHSFPGNVEYHIERDGDNLIFTPVVVDDMEESKKKIITLSLHNDNPKQQTKIMNIEYDYAKYDKLRETNVNLKTLREAKDEIITARYKGGKKRTHKNKRKSMKKKSMKKKLRKTMKKGNKYPGYKKNGGKRKNNRITKKRRKKGGNEGEGNEGKSWTCSITETLEECKNRARRLIRAGFEPLRKYTGMFEYPSWLEDSNQKRIDYEIELQYKILAKAAKYLEDHGEKAKEEDFYKYLMELAEEKEELIQKLINKRDRK